MPADVLLATFAVGKRAHSRTEGERVEGVSGIRDPTRGRMAGQERRIDDTILIREAQHGNRGAFEELVRHYDQEVLLLGLHLTRSRTRRTSIRTPSSRPTRTSEVFGSSVRFIPGFIVS